MPLPARLTAITLLALAACSSSPNPKLETEAAVRQALGRYLATRPNINMEGMELLITGVQFKGERAEVDVVYRAKTKGSAEGGSLKMRYSLTRKGDQWEVEPQSTAHGDMTPPAPASPADLPPGHPPVKKQ